MVHRVEELRQIKVHYPDVALICDFECLVNRGLTTPVRSKAVAVRAEHGFVFLTELLRYRLLNDSIDRSRDTQRSELMGWSAPNERSGCLTRRGDHRHVDT